jgi:hypothetical protein
VILMGFDGDILLLINQLVIPIFALLRFTVIAEL